MHWRKRKSVSDGTTMLVCILVFVTGMALLVIGLMRRIKG